MAWLRALWVRIVNFLYNEDRALASLAGADRQDTISGVAGQQAAKGNELAEVADRALDDVFGPNHAEESAKTDAALEAADKQVNG
jgi:hypothetical protein